MSSLSAISRYSLAPLPPVFPHGGSGAKEYLLMADGEDTEPVEIIPAPAPAVATNLSLKPPGQFDLIQTPR